MISMVPTEVIVVAIVVGVAAVAVVAIPQWLCWSLSATYFLVRPSVCPTIRSQGTSFFSIRSPRMDAHAATAVFDNRITQAARVNFCLPRCPALSYINTSQ